ncbi:MAG: hypothetical protein AAF533_00630 [Acidobacteriota bacterium]
MAASNTHRWQLLRVAAVFVPTLAFVGALLVAALPHVPAGWQRTAIDAATLLPGVNLRLDVTAAGSQEVLAVGRGPALAVRERAPASGPVETKPGLYLVVAAWAGLLGLALAVPTALPSTRQPLAISLGGGLVVGLALAFALIGLGGNWRAPVMRTLAGLPGLTQERGTAVRVVDADTVVARRHSLRSPGGLVAEYPAGPAPWPSKETVAMTHRGKTWLVGYSALFALGAALLWSLRQVFTWRARCGLAAAGLAVLAWFTVAALPDGWQRGGLQALTKLPGIAMTPLDAPSQEGQVVLPSARTAAIVEPRPESGEAVVGDVDLVVTDAATIGTHGSVVRMLGLPLAELPSEPSAAVGIELGLLAVLAIGMGLLVTPVGLSAAGLGWSSRAWHGWRERKAQAAQDARWEEATRLAVEGEPDDADRKNEEMRADVRSWLNESESGR